MLERLFIFRYLFAKTKGSVVRTIALISVGGVGFGVLAMVVVLSVMTGFDDAMKDRLLGASPHILVVDGTPELQDKIKKLIADNGYVDLASKQDIMIRTVDGIYSGAVAMGSLPVTMGRTLKRMSHKVEVVDSNKSGAILSQKNQMVPFETQMSPKEIAVGTDLARSLGIFEDDEVNIIAPESLLLPTGEMPLFEKVKVKALIRSEVPEMDQHMIFFDYNKGLRKFQDTASLEKVIEVRLENPDEASWYAKRIRKLTPNKVQTWKDLNSALFYSLKMEKTLMSIFLLLTVIVASFSIVSVLVILVTEKREDIGILRAIGATQKKVQSIFISIGMALGLLGIFSGTALGLGLSLFLEKHPDAIRLPEIYVDTTIPVRVEFLTIMGILFLGIALTLVGSWWPAWSSSKTEPVTALRRNDE